MPIADSDQLETLIMRNLCRDISHPNRDTQQYSDIEHTIIGNTPYVKIVNKLLRGGHRHLAYVNNDIEHTRDYENTSKPCHPNGAFPYKSELVYPIVPIRGEDNMTPKMLGFICIDCDKPNKFDEDRYDIPMVQGVVDGIYDLFVKRNNQ